RIAQDPRLFTFLSDAFPNGRDLRIVTGDARLEISRDQAHFGLLVIDAFSSDAIPVHLVTEEALVAYAAHVPDAGLIAWHISNRHVDLKPVLAALAEAQGFTALVRHDAPTDPLRTVSTWVVMSRERASLAAFDQWQALRVSPRVERW